MIDPLQSGLRQPTGGTNLWSLVQSDSLGLNPTDQEEHFSPAPQRFKLIYSTFLKGLLRLETDNRLVKRGARRGKLGAGIFQLGPFAPAVFLHLPGHKAEPALTIVLYDVQSDNKPISGR